MNNLYNTVFWALVVRGGLSNIAAEHRLKGTLSSDKNEILFGEFGINYNNEPVMFRKGTTIVRSQDDTSAKKDEEQASCDNQDWEKEHFAGLDVLHVDVIGNEFWNNRPHLLAPPDSNPPRIRS